MKAYFSLFKMRLINGLQYRTAALAGIATQFFFGFTFIMVYEAFYQNASGNQPISLDQVIDYVWLQQAFLVLIALWFRDGEIFNHIMSGSVAYELCRPCGLYGFWYSKLIAQRLSGAFLRCLPLLVIVLLLPEPYRLSLPKDFTAFAVFIATLAMGLLVVVSISMLIHISVFITLSPMGSILMIGVLGEFLAGMTIPVPLMPEWMQKAAYFLPFRLAVDLPFRVYSGNIRTEEALASILIQLLWLVVLVLAGRIFLDRILKKAVVQGG